MTEEIEKTQNLPPIPDKHYFTIGDVSDWCDVEQHVLRYWEQEFKQLKPVRRGGRRFYTQDDMQVVKKIYTLLKHEGYTIEGAKRKINSDEYNFRNQYNDRLVGEIINELQDILKSMK